MIRAVPFFLQARERPNDNDRNETTVGGNDGVGKNKENQQSSLETRGIR